MSSIISASTESAILGRKALSWGLWSRGGTVSDPISWPPDIDKLTEEILDLARAPVDLPTCFVEWLRDFWMDNSEDEARRHWRERAELGFWVCCDYLRCLAAVLEKPPRNLIQLMQVHGWINLYHRDVQPWRPYSYDEYLSWLDHTRVDFERIVEAVTREDVQ